MTMTLRLLLLLGLCQKTVSEGPPQSPESPDVLGFELPAVNYETETADSFTPGPIGALFRMVQVFLRVVQPAAFPEDILRKIIQRKFDFSADYEKVIHYELGILICAVLGLLFVILMPLVGLCFCACRCCHRCGGDMHQRQKRNGTFLRKYYAVSLLVIGVFISIGIIFGFVANHHLRTQIQKTRKLVDNNFKDLRTFLNETPSQISFAVSQYNTTKKKAFSDLDNIKSLLGGRIHQQLRPKVIPVLNDIKAMAEAIRDTKDALVKLNNILEELKMSSARLSTVLSNVKMDLEQSLGDPVCSTPAAEAVCNSIRATLSQLDDNINLSQLPSLDKEIDNVQHVLQTDLSSLAQEGYKSFNDIPEMMQNQTADMVSGIKNTLNAIGLNVETINEKIYFQDKMSDLLGHISYAESYIRHLLPKLEEYYVCWWLGGLVVCCLLTLIMVFYYLGLLCGTVGYDRNATPTTRGCVSNTGGIFLMVGVGVSFLFCWILMITVVLTFIVGGNVEKLVCEPYQNKKLFQILDTPYLLNENWKYYLSGMIFDKPDINLTFKHVYSDCKDNKSIYSALKLENKYNISEHFDIEEYTGHINSSLDNMNMEVNNVVLLDAAGKKNLRDFGHSGVDRIDYDAYLAETAKMPTKVDLLTFADDLDEKANKLPSGNLKWSLTTSAQRLRKTHHGEVVPLASSLKSLHQSIQELQQQSSGLGVKVTNIISSLDAAQDFITNNLSPVIAQESKNYRNTIVGYFEHYMQWVKISIKERIAACKPVATALDSAVDIFLCNYITKPMNLYWFGIGLATLFLLPAIIFAVKLAKYYRRMDSEDVYDDVETIPMKNMQKGTFGFHRHQTTQLL
ncbi:prominin-1 isoform X2 [Molossus molossus]|uniref:Prominin 1 n=1 Tax=Molossus molossus TaxID=27622 RepID=A0A7J8JZA9_MOLMO|nr:prominin-1 isoform X2 [Molossus molossus]KAF6502108.1 prominin 1 [Molossus molossus]